MSAGRHFFSFASLLCSTVSPLFAISAAPTTPIHLSANLQFSAVVIICQRRFLPLSSALRSTLSSRLLRPLGSFVVISVHIPPHSAACLVLFRAVAFPLQPALIGRRASAGGWLHCGHRSGSSRGRTRHSAHATFATPTLGLRARYASDLGAAKTYPPAQPSYLRGSPAASYPAPETARHTGVLKDSAVSIHPPRSLRHGNRFLE